MSQNHPLQKLFCPSDFAKIMLKFRLVVAVVAKGLVWCFIIVMFLVSHCLCVCDLGSLVASGCRCGVDDVHHAFLGSSNYERMSFPM